jgi:hypothetical protein
MKMRAILAACVFAGLITTGCQTAQPPVINRLDPSIQPAGPPPTATFVPAGTMLTVTLTTELSTRDSRVGDIFTATVKDALVAENGDVVVPSGSVITGLVTGVGKSGEQAAIRLNFTRINIKGTSHPFTAQITSTREPERETHDVARATVVGAVAGVVLGTIIGDGGLRDALIGGALGAGAGTIVSLGMGGTDSELEEGTKLTLQTKDRVDLR